jgi:mRNA-degrading endonuclease YafQ of YafQ-DinJ toxin-antitoxin module
MKKIRTTPYFDKVLKERITKNSALLEIFKESVNIFLHDRENPFINDHLLERDMNGYMAFSITHDLRVIYKELEEYFLFLDVGTHQEVYRK